MDFKSTLPLTCVNAMMIMMDLKSTQNVCHCKLPNQLLPKSNLSIQVQPDRTMQPIYWGSRLDACYGVLYGAIYLQYHVSTF